MIWNDAVLNLALTDDQLSEVLARVFNVPRASVAIVDAVENVPEDVSVACIRTKGRGDFDTVLNFYLSELPVDSLACLKALSRSFQSDILTSDDTTVSPYSMLRIAPDGSVQPVTVSAMRLDSAEEYVLTRA